MLYKFKSKAAGDVIMLGANGDHVMRLIGREPQAHGIFEVEAMPGLIAALQAAVAADEGVAFVSPALPNDPNEPTAVMWQAIPTTSPQSEETADLVRREGGEAISPKHPSSAWHRRRPKSCGLIAARPSL